MSAMIIFSVGEVLDLSNTKKREKKHRKNPIYQEMKFARFLPSEWIINKHLTYPTPCCIVEKTSFSLWSESSFPDLSCNGAAFQQLSFCKNSIKKLTIIFLHSSILFLCILNTILMFETCSKMYVSNRELLLSSGSN